MRLLWAGLTVGSDQVSPLSAETTICKLPPGGHASPPPSPTYCTSSMVSNAFDEPQCGWQAVLHALISLALSMRQLPLHFPLLPGELFRALRGQCLRLRAYLALRGAGAAEDHVDYVSLHVDVRAPQGPRGAGLDAPGRTKGEAAVIGERPVCCLLDAALVPGRRSLQRQMPKNHIREYRARKKRNLCGPCFLGTAH